jgi:peptidylprolyl isomerase
MKKSEKLKGKAAAAERKKDYTRYAVAGAVIALILIIAGFYFSGPGQLGAKNGDTVVVYFTGSYENGTVFDSNLEREPLVFTLGNNTMIPGFEEAIVGMAPNTTKTVTIPFEKAYGPYREDLVLVVNRSALPEGIEPVVGNFYTIERKDDGALARVRITNVTDDTVTLDQNHLLAGQNLKYVIRFERFYSE